MSMKYFLNKLYSFIVAISVLFVIYELYEVNSYVFDNSLKSGPCPPSSNIIVFKNTIFCGTIMQAYYWKLHNNLLWISLIIMVSIPLVRNILPRILGRRKG